MEATESHGIFQFGDFDFENITNSRVFNVATNFVPKYHFKQHYSCSRDEIQLKLDLKYLKDLVYTIENLYFKQRYREALELCQEFLKVMDKGSKQIYIAEIATRCCLKLQDFQAAQSFTSKLNSKEPGQLFLKAQVDMLNRNYSESLKGFTNYLQLRRSDYNAWKEIAKIFHEIDDSYLEYLATDKCIQLAKRNQKHNPLQRKRRSLEILTQRMPLLNRKSTENQFFSLKRYGVDEKTINSLSGLLLTDKDEIESEEQSSKHL